MRKYVLCLAVLCAACTTSTAVRIDSYSDVTAIPKGFVEGTKFAIIPKFHANELFAQEIAQIIRSILVQRGYEVVEQDQAEFHLNFDVDTKTVSKTVMVNEEIPDVPVKNQEWVKDKEGKWKYEQTFKISTKIIEKPVIKTYHIQDCSISVLRADSLKPVWNGTASCDVQEDNDMRERLDFLLMPLLNYFGSSTKKQITMNLKEKDLDLYGRE